MKKRIHNKIKVNHFKKNVCSVLLFILCYIVPILVMISGLFITYYMITTKGYDSATNLWNIEYSFRTGIIGIFVTIFITFILIKILHKFLDYHLY